MLSPADRIEQLRRWRSRPERDQSVGRLIAERAKQAKQAQRRLGSFVDLWESVIPTNLSPHTRVTALRGGVVHVVVDSSATAYELDRGLREGLEERLRRAFGRTLVRVRITVGEV